MLHTALRYRIPLDTRTIILMTTMMKGMMKAMIAGAAGVVAVAVVGAIVAVEGLYQCYLGRSVIRR
jgi:hypothetical protein